MENYNLPADKIHAGYLRKFAVLKGVEFEGKDFIKNLPKDRFVKVENHHLHGLVRGFYSPSGKDYLLSYQATEKEENYGEQIVWEDDEKTSFEKIYMKPPSSEGDRLKENDIKAARVSMKNNYPIGILHNKSKGVNKCLGLGIIEKENEGGIFVVKPVQLSNSDLENFYQNRHYCTLTTKKENTAEAIENRENIIMAGELQWYGDKLDTGDIIFVILGGDRPPWDPGFRAVCRVVKKPYDHGYDETSGGTELYKLKLSVDINFPSPLQKVDYSKYKDGIGIPNIGPEIKNTPNQPLYELDREQAVVIARGLLDNFDNIFNEMHSVFGQNFIEEAQKEMPVLIEKRLKYGEEPKVYYTSPERITKDKWEPNIESIIGELNMEEGPLKNLKHFINNGKNVILMGPPGTGKTTIAENAALDAIENEFISDKKIVTATADWTTFDTIGGYMPGKNNEIEFVEGAVLESIRDNSWLIIDEINRADIDKALGEIFTVLSGREVELPYKTGDVIEKKQKRLEIGFTRDKVSGYNEIKGRYEIGTNWRILCTMNTFDKEALFEISYALMRRFAFIDIPVPEENRIQDLIKEKSNTSNIKNAVQQVIDSSPIRLGPAVILDLIDHINSAGTAEITAGITGLVIPQFEGLRRTKIIEFHNEMIKNSHIEKGKFTNVIEDFFDIPKENLDKGEE